MASGPRDLSELRHASDAAPSWFLDLVLPDIGGGRLDVSQLAVIDENPQATALRVSGLDQATFERLVADYGRRFLSIEFWKCPRIEDLTPLEDLPGLQMVSFYWNQRTTRLWNLARTPELRALRFEDFRRLHHLDDLREGVALEEVVFGDAVWSKSVFETLEPLAALACLRSLSFTAKRVEDDRIQPLGALTNLETLTFPTNLFTAQQVAWLRARLPYAVDSDVLAAVLPLTEPLELAGKPRDVLLIGKRKPFLDSALDEVRIRKHVAAFQRMVEEFRDDPTLDPD